MIFNNSSHPLTVRKYTGLDMHVAMDGDTAFDNAEAQGEAFIHGRSTSGNFYIKPTDDGKPHILPQYAAIPVMHLGETWQAPSEERVQAVKKMIEGTTGFAALSDPKWIRLNHFLNLHQDTHQPKNTPLAQTDMGWLHRNYAYTHGQSVFGIEYEGWYHGANFRSGGNGFDNNHYARLLYMTMRFVNEPSKSKRDSMWPYLLEQIMCHLCYGRFHGGPNKGFAVDEKGNVFLGDTNRVPISKQWVHNVAVGYLLTGHRVFLDMLNACAAHWLSKPASGWWSGYWGVRQAARCLEDCTLLYLLLPEMRAEMRAEMSAMVIGMLDQLSLHLDRQSWVWPNKGNGGSAEESPWMGCQAVAAIKRSHELVPGTDRHGPTNQELEEVMRVMFSDVGSDDVGGYRLLRYRYHTTTDRVRFLASTAWALPALRHLSNHSNWAEAQFKETTELMQLYAGSPIIAVANGTPTPIEQIGFRHPPEGGAWTKTILAFLEAVR